MSIQDIINNIEAEKTKAIAALDKELEDALSKLEEDHEKKKEALKEDYKNRVAEKSSSIEKKAKAQANMEKKIMLLKAKRESLEEAFGAAVEKLSTSKSYTDILAILLKKVDLPKAKVIAAKGKKSETAAALKSAGKDYEVDSEGAFAGGCIVIADDVEIDLSFKTLINSLRGEVETDVAHKLFS